MKKNKILSSTCLAGLALTGFSLGSCNLNENRNPNIIIILADDLGYGDVEVLNNESGIRTPNLNRLAGDGLIFTDAHTPSGVCSPTRYGLLTGRYCWRTRLESGVLWDYAGTLIEPGRVTISQMLQEEGYYTGMVGKWHLGINWKLFDETAKDLMATDPKYSDFRNIDFSSPHDIGINDFGFDYSFAISGSANMTPFTYFENCKATLPPVYTTEEIRLKNGEWYGSEGHVAENFTLGGNIPTFSKKACDFLENAVLNHPDKPFFLYYPLVSPHTPVVPNEEFAGRSNAGAYGDFVEETDFYIGVLLNKLEELGIDKNTIVIFTSDNGPENDKVRSSKTKGDPIKYEHVSQAPFRGWKRELLEGGHHVPFFVRWPDKIKPGYKCSTTICLTDIFPTFAELLEVQFNEFTAEDGVSFLDAVYGKDRPGSFHEAIIHHEGNGSFAIRKGNYKLIINGPKSPAQILDDMVPVSFVLYDVERDIKETNDISGNHPEIIKELHELLKKYILEGKSNNHSEKGLD